MLVDDINNENASPERAAGSGPSCLVVDDDPGICRAISFVLRKLALEVRVAVDPLQLASQLSERAPELIFLDVHVGRATAPDLLRMLSRHNYRGLVQVMSGLPQRTLDEIEDLGLSQGLRMLPPLAKPFRMQVVRELIARQGFTGVTNEIP